MRTSTLRFLTIRAAARQIMRHPDYTRGAADVAGIQLVRAGRALLMTPEDFERLKAAIEAAPEPIEASSDVCSSVQ